jgi:hypothetical protein
VIYLIGRTGSTKKRKRMHHKMLRGLTGVVAALVQSSICLRPVQASASDDWTEVPEAGVRRLERCERQAFGDRRLERRSRSDVQTLNPQRERTGDVENRASVKLSRNMEKHK